MSGTTRELINRIRRDHPLSDLTTVGSDDAKAVCRSCWNWGDPVGPCDALKAATILDLFDRTGDAERTASDPDDADDWLRHRMASILERTANALNGPPPPLTWWSWHDLPELAEKLRASEAELDPDAPRD